MGLRRYFAKRVAYTIALLFLIIAFNYFLFQVLPFTTVCPKETSYVNCVEGLYLPEQPPKSQPDFHLQEVIRAQIRTAFGFDKPPLTRFLLYTYDMFTFNFGYHVGSFGTGPVKTTIVQRMPYTLLLLGSSTVAGFVFGIGLGVVAAAKRGKVVDIGFLSSLLFLNSLPVFFLGAILELMQVFFTGGSYISVGTATQLQYGLDLYSKILQSMFLPFLTLTFANLGGVFLTQRAVMIDTVSEDYIQIARAKGLPERTVLFKHAFRNAVLPIFTAFALSIGFILSGAVITETVFRFPGLGKTLFDGVTAYDFPLEQALFFIISVMVVLAVFFADVTYGLLDPRVSTA